LSITLPNVDQHFAEIYTAGDLSLRMLTL